MTAALFLMSLLLITHIGVTFSSSESVVGCPDDMIFFGSVAPAYDPSSEVASIRASCTDFSNSTKLALGSGQQLTHLKYDPHYQLVYWADWDSQSVRRGLVETKPCFSEDIIEGVKGGVIDLDPVNRKLYWATKYLDGSVDAGIGTSDLNGDNLSILYDIDNDAQDVVDIRVDPDQRLIFWGTSVSRGNIVKGSIDGGNHTILHSDVQVNCIEISPQEERVYWLTFLVQGSSPATLQWANYAGNNEDTNFATVDVNIKTDDMVLYDGYFYVTTISLDLETFESTSVIYRLANMKGAQAVAMDLETPFSYLTVDLGSIAPTESVISLEDNEYYAEEGDNLTVLLERSGNLFHCSSATIVTDPGTATTNKDFKHLHTLVQFQAYSTIETVELQVLFDEEVESQETFVVLLFNSVGGRLGDNHMATVFIKGSPIAGTTGGLNLSLKPEFIVLIVLGAAAVILIIIFVAVFSYRKHKSNKTHTNGPAFTEEMKDAEHPLRRDDEDDNAERDK